MIRAGSIVRCLDSDGVWHEAIADGPAEDGLVWVRFTTCGDMQPWPANKVQEVAEPW